MNCGAKQSYSKKEAQRVRNCLRNSGRIVRIYACDCGKWHLTHKGMDFYKYRKYAN